MSEDRTARSLRVQFRWRLVALQALILSAVVTVLVAALTVQGAFNPIEPGDDVIAAVRDAAARGPDGQIALRPTPELAALRAQVPGLWFILRDRAGHRLSEGVVPPALARIGTALDDIGQARFGSNFGDAPRPTARMQWIDTAIGRVQIITGPGAQAPWYRTLGATSFAILVFLLPILAIMTLATWLATPGVIRASLRGLDGAIAAAERIDIDRRGERLPLAAVPREVRPLVDAINTTLERLDEGHERHRRFLADAAHELRTPIAVLTTRLGLLPPGPDRAKLLQDIGRLATLAEQLLDLERLRRHIGDAIAPVDLVELARGVVSDLAPMAIDAGYAISLDAKAEQVEVLADRTSLERALTNLVQNAVQHGLGRGAILVRVAAGGCIEVHDEGPGIREGDRDRVFEPFRRLSGTSGSGLGLHLASEVIALHGGRIAASDSPLGGLCMRIMLPQIDPERRKLHATERV